MDDFSKNRMWMIIVLIFVFLAFSSAAFIFAFWIPSAAQARFGQPGGDLSLAKQIFLGAQLITRFDDLDSSTADLEETQTFSIIPGMTAAEISAELEKQGLINDADLLRVYWAYKGADRFVRDGVYLIQPMTTTLEIGNQLVSGEMGYKTFAILSGWRKDEVDHLLVQSGLVDQVPELKLSECYPVIQNTAWGVEGFLAPGSYQIPDGSVAKDIYCMFIERFFSSIPDEYINQVTQNGLNIYEAVNLASIIEREMIDETEAGRIAGVFYNRLAAGMPLQSDPTVQYAVGSSKGGPNWWDIHITESDLKIDSPYNTYRINGLPPSPICAPSEAALAAVAEPESHGYLYFRAACDGSGKHNFSRTYEEHVAAACE